MCRKPLYSLIIICLTVSFIHSQKTSDKTSIIRDEGKTANPVTKAVDLVKLIEGNVVKVLNGDAVNIKTREDKTYLVKLQGIDAPEDEQPYAVESKEQLSDLILGKHVMVIVRQMDQYNRYIGTVYYDEKDINLLQIESGSAWHFKQFESEQSVNDRLLYSQAEKRARLERKGLWEKVDPIPPWNFKVNKTSKEAKVKESNEKQTQLPLISDESDSKEKPKSNSKTLSNKKYIRGPRGGCYYINSGGGKTYVKRELCQE